ALYTARLSSNAIGLVLNDLGNVEIGSATSATSARVALDQTISADSSTTSIAGVFGNYTFNPSAGGTQVGNRFVVNNAPTSTANTSVNQIIRTIDNTALANTVRGIEIVSSAGSNTAGTNTGLRATGATFGVQAITTGLAGGVALPAALYGESTGTTQGDILRLYSNTITTTAQMAYFYHDTTTFSGTGLLMDFATASGTFSGNFLDLQNNNVSKFKVTSAGNTSMNLATSTNNFAICHETNGAGVDQLKDCNGAPSADYAEMYPIEYSVEFGDIVTTGSELITTYDVTDGSIDWNKVKGKVTKLVKSNKAYQKNVIGIVSDNYGDFSSTGNNIKEEDNPMPVALSGRVPVKISANSGAIMPGDYLTTSEEPGKATKALKAGPVIGKALESWDGGSDKVMVYIEQGYYNGQRINDFAGLILNNSDEDSATLMAKLLSDKGQLESQSFNLSELLTDRIVAGLEIITPKLIASDVATTSLLVKGNATFAGLTLLSGDTIFSGNVTFNTGVQFDLAPVFNKDTAGFALVKEGDKSVEVVFEKPYAMTPVVTTSIVYEATDNIDAETADSVFAQNINSLVINKTEKGFTIILNKNAPQNVRFSWIALGVKDATVFESLTDGLELNSSPSSEDPTPPQVDTYQTPSVTPDAYPTPASEVTPIPEVTPTPDVTPEATAPTPEVISTPDSAPTPTQ
ncbi:MAG: hypothetical protein ABIR14_01290, partial [Candidatus Paceibacterota bacterium]